MTDYVIEKLKEIMTRYDASILDDPARCEALLRDFLSNNKKELNILIIALKAGIVNDLSLHLLHKAVLKRCTLFQVSLANVIFIWFRSKTNK